MLAEIFFYSSMTKLKARGCAGGDRSLRFSALVVWIVLFQQPNVGERKVASFAFAFTLPLAVHVDLGHFYGVPHLLNNKKKSQAYSAILTRPLHALNKL